MSLLPKIRFNKISMIINFNLLNVIIDFKILPIVLGFYYKNVKFIIHQKYFSYYLNHKGNKHGNFKCIFNFLWFKKSKTFLILLLL